MNQSLIIVTENKKKHKIVAVTAFSNKAKEEYEKIFKYIVSKVPNALVGFNKENREEVKKKLKMAYLKYMPFFRTILTE